MCRYWPRLDGGDNGRIGDYEITLYTDAAPDGVQIASGTWEDDPLPKEVTWELQEGVRGVKLTALTEAGGRGPWSCASEIQILEPREYPALSPSPSPSPSPPPAECGDQVHVHKTALTLAHCWGQSTRLRANRRYPQRQLSHIHLQKSRLRFKALPRRLASTSGMHAG